MSEKEIVIIHNKLVRDKIPALLQKKQICCHTKILERKEMENALKQKLKEEVEEFLKASTREEKLEELSDILEVIFALSDEAGCKQQDLEKIRQSKKEKRGGFLNGIYLEKTVAKPI